MQTIPVFAYLVPILVMFGSGPVAALIATIIYAMPPMVRTSLLALKMLILKLKRVDNVWLYKKTAFMASFIPVSKPTLMVGKPGHNVSFNMVHSFNDWCWRIRI